MSQTMYKLRGPNGATFEVVDNAGVAEILLGGIQVVGEQGASIASLTDNSGGTANDTITAVGGLTTLTDSTGHSGTHDDTLADVTAKINAILVRLRNAGTIAT